MPIYEYVCEDDGQRLSLMRPMRDADAPVDDPEGRGRAFVRVHSTFSVGGSPASGRPAPAMPSGGCACGNPHGPCGA